MQDILIDVFIGRHRTDLLHLCSKYQQLFQRNISSVTDMSESRVLREALEIVFEQNRPNEGLPVDGELVHRDITYIVSILEATFPSSDGLFNILLRRSNTHLLQLSLLYEIQTGRPLHIAICQNMMLNPIAKKIALQAVRTATNLTDRDAKLLLEALGSRSLTNQRKLAIRVTRMHYYKQHWMQIKGECLGITGKDFKSQMNRRYIGVFRELMSAMAGV